MRDAIRGVYHTESWNEKVDNMLDEQVVAVYLKFKKQGKFDTYSEEPKQAPKVEVIFKGESLIDLDKCKERWLKTLREFCIKMTDEELKYFNELPTYKEAQAFYWKLIRERL
jgi:hypothetical protein